MHGKAHRKQRTLPSNVKSGQRPAMGAALPEKSNVQVNSEQKSLSFARIRHYRHSNDARRWITLPATYSAAWVPRWLGKS
jgi:hypothetical protein